MKTAVVLTVAGVLMLLVIWKFLIPLGFLLLGYGTEVSLPGWLIRSLSPRVVVLMGFFLGPLLMVTIVMGAWLLLRHK